MIGLLLGLLIAAAIPAAAQTEAQLFPQPFLVEHHVEQTDPDGGRFATEGVVDHYAGSKIISVRPDGSRLIVDLAQRQITDIDPAAGTYTVLSFDQMIELQRRLRAADRAQVGLPPETPESEVSDQREGDTEGGGEPRFSFAELPLRQDIDPTSLRGKAATADLLDRPGVRHLRVTIEQANKAGEETPAVDVWVDSGVRLSTAAVEALGRFELEVLSPHPGKSMPFSSYVAAARKQTGAFPVRTSRPMTAKGGKAGAGKVEDIATRLEPLAVLPEELSTVPDGFQRTVHPLEQMVAFAEEEAELNLRALRAVEQ
jgi:hypothetical protein